jgi:hypothetical protein
VFRLRRDTGGLDGVRTSKEIIHGIVSVTAGYTGPKHLNHYAIGHWVVESRQYLIRNVTFQKDDSQLRTGNAPRNEPQWTGRGSNRSGPDGDRTALDQTWQNKNRVFPVQGPSVAVAAVRRRAATTRS